MKKLNYLLSLVALTVAMGMVSCTKTDNPIEPDEPVVPAPLIHDGDELAEAIAQYSEVINGVPTLTLPAGVTVNMNQPIEITFPLVIIGDEENPATIVAGETGIVTSNTISFINVNIDATALTTPLIKFAELEEGVIIELPSISFENVAVKSLPYQLIYANKQSYLLNALYVENSIIGVDGTNKKSIFDFNGGGNTCLLSINNSTIYANPTNGQNGGFFSSQSGKEVTDLGGAEATATTSITNSTIYNITNGKTTSTLRKNSQAYQKYIVKNCIVVNSGKSGQFLKGLNAGQAGKDTNWEVDGNVFNFDGANITEQNVGSTEGNVKNSIEAVITFADAANGDFTQSDANAGDPRWIK